MLCLNVSIACYEYNNVYLELVMYSYNTMHLHYIYLVFTMSNTNKHY